MIIAYIIILLFTLRTLFKGYSDTRTMMEKIRSESGAFNLNWVRVMLISTWGVILFLILFAKVKLGLPAILAFGLIALKLPSVFIANGYFESGVYNRKTYIADKMDQWTNVFLCGYAFYRYLFRL